MIKIMDLLKALILTSLIIVLFSCNNKRNATNNISEDTFVNNYANEFSRQNSNKVDMIHSIDYYKNEITIYEDNYYGFKNISMEITQMMNISQIITVDNFVPNLLTFLVSWFNQKGYIYYLYTFGKDQKIIEHYYLGQFIPFENHKKLMKKTAGNIFEYGDISTGDFNNDGINEILLYSDYKNIGYVFCVYEYNIFENRLEELCLVPVYINFYNPFPSVEYIENGFKILEIIDNENLDLTWNKYIWNKEIRKYIKQ